MVNSICQDKGLDALNTWIKSDDILFCLYGAAGTGKTTLLKQFLNTISYKVCLTAPTHKAVTMFEKILYIKGKTIQKLLGLKPNIKLHISPRGLTYAQFRAMIQLKSKKYSELTSEQLKTLRDRILFALEENVRFHIVQWEQRKHQIEVVAESKRWEL